MSALREVRLVLLRRLSYFTRTGLVLCANERLCYLVSDKLEVCKTRNKTEFSKVR